MPFSYSPEYREMGLEQVRAGTLAVDLAKSHATAAWECRNFDHVTADRWGAGSMPAFFRMSQIVDAAMLWPSPTTSPWMRR